MIVLRNIEKLTESILMQKEHSVKINIKIVQH